MVDGQISGLAIPAFFAAVILLEFIRRLRRGSVPLPENVYEDPSKLLRRYTPEGAGYVRKLRRHMLQNIALMICTWFLLDYLT